MAGTAHGAPTPSRPPMLKSSSPKKVASAPIAAGVVTRRYSHPKVKAAGSP